MSYRCDECGREFKTVDAKRQHLRDSHRASDPGEKDMEPDWEGSCENCGESPIVPMTGLCGPCTWGEADTAGGNW